jgi:hypothetical protein
MQVEGNQNDGNLVEVEDGVGEKGLQSSMPGSGVGEMQIGDGGILAICCAARGADNDEDEESAVDCARRPSRCQNDRADLHR